MRCRVDRRVAFQNTVFSDCRILSYSLLAVAYCHAMPHHAMLCAREDGETEEGHGK